MARYAPPTRDYSGNSYGLSVTTHIRPFTLDGRDLQHVVLDIRWATREQVADTLAGTVDNRAGYGDAEAAQRVARSCAALLKAGVTATYDTMSWSTRTTGVSLSWQQYDDSRYCTYSVESLGSRDSIDAWEARVGFVRWLERLVGGDMADPRTLLLALRRKKAVAILPWKERVARYGESSHSGGWVATSWDDVLASLPVLASASEAA